MFELAIAALGVILGYLARYAYERIPQKPRPRVSFANRYGEPVRVVVENCGARAFTVVSVRFILTDDQLTPSGVVVRPHESAVFSGHPDFDGVYVQISGAEPVTCLPDQ